MENLNEQDAKEGFFRCEHCNQLFTSSQQSWMLCPKGKVSIDVHGKAKTPHSPDTEFDIKHFLEFLRTCGWTWEKIFWKIWSLMLTLHCDHCHEPFTGAGLNMCTYHPGKAEFGYGSNHGK